MTSKRKMRLGNSGVFGLVGDQPWWEEEHVQRGKARHLSWDGSRVGSGRVIWNEWSVKPSWKPRHVPTVPSFGSHGFPSLPLSFQSSRLLMLLWFLLPCAHGFEGLSRLFSRFPVFFFILNWFGLWGVGQTHRSWFSTAMWPIKRNSCIFSIKRTKRSPTMQVTPDEG